MPPLWDSEEWELFDYVVMAILIIGTFVISFGLTQWCLS